MHFKRMGCKIRIDTDGLANLVHGKNVLPELMFVDVVSVSMNAPDSETYQKIIKTPFGDEPSRLSISEGSPKYIPR
jgi:TatD DNase family protein